MRILRTQAAKKNTDRLILSELKKSSAVSISLRKVGVSDRRIAVKPNGEFLRKRMSLLILGIKGSTSFPIYRDPSRSEGLLSIQRQ
jgi:hypothetical protein